MAAGTLLPSHCHEEMVMALHTAWGIGLDFSRYCDDTI
jgi:hypothetical protein